jgi:hypothetical protein
VISPSPDENDAHATPNNVIGSQWDAATVTNDARLNPATTSTRCGTGRLGIVYNKGSEARFPIFIGHLSSNPAIDCYE